MSINSALSPSISPIPFKDIQGFDAIPSDLMGCIGEYVGCLAEGDQPSWDIYRNDEYFRVLFAPRLKHNRLLHIAQMDNELNKEYASYQNYKRIVDCWNISKLLLKNHWDVLETLLGEHLNRVAEDQAFYSLPTLRQFLLKGPASFPRDVLAVCDVLDQENNGEARIVFPTQRLRAIIQNMQRNVDADADVVSYRNVRTTRFFKKMVEYSVSASKKVLACAVAVCLIARHIFSEIVPLTFWKVALKGLVKGGLVAGLQLAMHYGPSRQVLQQAACVISQIAPRHVVIYFAGLIAIFHIAFHIGGIYCYGVQEMWKFDKARFKVIAQDVGHIWRSRELITDLYMKGIAAHASIVIQSVRRLGPIQGLRHGFRVLARGVQQGLA